MLSHVTGANGIVGKEVTKALAELGDVHATDVDDMDVTNHRDVLAKLSENPPDVVIHLAGLKGNLPSQQDPLKFFDVNTSGTLNLLEAARQVGVKRFVFFSSMTVHGPTTNPVDETSPLFPQHPYSGSKGASESIVQAYSNAYGISATIFRPNFIVSPIPYPLPYVDNLIYDFIDLIHRDGIIELAGDGSYEREWMHPMDVASAVAAAVSTDLAGCKTYIIRGERVTMYEFATRIVEKVGRGEITTNLERSGFSITSSDMKARTELGWAPKIDLDSLVTSIWNEYKSRHG